MPTTQVYTWDQFVNAYQAQQGTQADPYVIEIMADLDVASSITGPYYADVNGTRYKRINGNYHNISNIATQTTFNNAIFTGSHVTWDKCNFVNVYRNNPYPIFFGASDNAPTFNDCTIQGQGICICGQGNMSANYTGRGIFNRCVLTWRQVGTSYTGACFGSASFDYCYLDITIGTSAVGNYDISTVAHSYIKGSITGDTTGRRTSMISSCSDTVINIDTDLNYTLVNTPGMLSVYNTDRLTGNIVGTTNMIGVTDAQLKDAAYLASIGFNIIV